MGNLILFIHIINYSVLSFKLLFIIIAYSIHRTSLYMITSRTYVNTIIEIYKNISNSKACWNVDSLGIT